MWTGDLCARAALTADMYIANSILYTVSLYVLSHGNQCASHGPHACLNLEAQQC